MNYDEALANVTGEGSLFETAPAEIRGNSYTVFKHAPSSLRQIFDLCRMRGDAPCLVFEDERWTFTDVFASVDALGAALVDRYGIEKGDRVAIAMRNLPEWIVTYAAALSVGAVVVPLNAWWTTDELEYGLRDSSPRLVVVDSERLARVSAACTAAGIEVLGARLPAGSDGCDRWEDVVTPLLGAPMPSVEVDRDDDATILYTSGTTGLPKGAVSTHGAIVQALMGFGCRVTVDRMRVAGREGGSTADPYAFILAVPLFHVTGCVAVMLSCLTAGYKLVMMGRWEPDRALELIERERVTHFVGVPTQSWDMVESPRFAEFDTSSLVTAIGGGAPAPAELVKRVASSFRTAGPGIGYGMTETNAYGPQNSGADYLERPTSVGRAMPILDVEVRDDKGEPVAVGERGEIWLKGPNLIRGYWNAPEATAEAIVDGWLRTGDVGRIDEDGYVYVEDRLKDMVLRGGENVYCAEVENAVYEHPAVHEAAVVGVPHERLGEEVGVVVHLRAGATLSVDELQAHVRARLAAFKVPTKVVFSDEPLPRNAAGKVLKTELRRVLA